MLAARQAEAYTSLNTPSVRSKPDAIETDANL